MESRTGVTAKTLQTFQAIKTINTPPTLPAPTSGRARVQPKEGHMQTNSDTGAIGAIHHITAISGSARETDRFYRRLLGLRRVKRTVNFDDPTTYHLYYGDGLGRPGTLLTFFPWGGIPPGRAGTGAVSAVALAVPAGALGYWERRLTTAGVAVRRETRFDGPLLAFADPDGLRLELVPDTTTVPAVDEWIGPVPPEAAVAGIFGATATVSPDAAIRDLLTERLGMRPTAGEGRRTRFEAVGTAGPGRFYDLVTDPGATPGRQGAGTVHHIAFRAPGLQDQLDWRRRIARGGLDVTPVIDRDYFRSIYFRTPGGVLMEIATDAPGFARDEPVAELGKRLMLPERYEEGRQWIESHLPPLVAADDLVHVHRPGTAGRTADGLVVPLHGTGGDERDLLPLAREIFGPAPPIVSPRGAVDENGLRRFFRRSAPGRFDPAEVARRAHQLAHFLLDAREVYGHADLPMAALGYSNGANIAAASMLLRPEVFDAAILLRPMMPLPAVEPSDLSGKRVLILRGRHDTVIPAAGTDALESALRRAGAAVCTVSLNAGHRLTEEDVEVARRWPARPDACKAAA